MRFGLCLAVLGFLALAVAPAPVHATDYTYRNGYYWNGTRAYTRSKVYYPQTYTYRQVYNPSTYSYYYQQVADPLYYYYEYTEQPGVTYQQQTTQTYSTPANDWRQALLDIAKNRDRYEAQMRKAQQDHQQYQEALKSLGLEGNFRLPNYGQYGPLRQYDFSQANLHYGSFGAQGNSIYGYSVNQTRDAYGTTDLNALYQQAARLTQGAQALAGDANKDFTTLAANAGDRAAAVAEIQAKGLAAAAALQAANAAPSSRSSTTTTITRGQSGVSGVGGPDLPPAPPAMAPAATATEVQGVLNSRCAKCHSGAEAKGGLDLTKWAALPEDRKEKARFRLFHPDPAKRMPLADSGGPGQPLPINEKVLFIAN